MVDRILHGENLLKKFTEAMPEKRVYFIKGDVEVEDREVIKKIMNEENDIICIAMSKIFSTGISINNIHYIVFASIGKSKVKILQSIGRGLRLHPEKKSLVLLDIVDNLKYGTLHYGKRKKFYERENINITEKEIQES
jgi:superfamily II DNA or RNA helicase